MHNLILQCIIVEGEWLASKLVVPYNRHLPFVFFLPEKSSKYSPAMNKEKSNLKTTYKIAGVIAWVNDLHDIELCIGPLYHISCV